MLVDLPDDHLSPREKSIRDTLAAEGYPPPDPNVRIGTGMYQGYLDEYALSEKVLKDAQPFSPWYSRDLSGDEHMRERLRLLKQSFDEDWPQDFGVCDSPEQVTERWPLLLESTRKFVIIYREILKKDQPPEGGWRWHKWGEYIGRHQPQHEYLSDEPDIDKVVLFQIYEVH